MIHKMEVEIAGVRFKNPLIAASGTFGYGKEYEKFYSLSKLGGISVKGTTDLPRIGNLSPRIAETPMGMLNSVGLENPGIDHFIEHELPWLMQKNTTIIANIAAGTEDLYAKIAQKLDKTNIHMVELKMHLMVLNMKAKLKIILMKDMEYIIFLMEIDLKVLLKIIFLDMEHFFLI